MKEDIFTTNKKYDVIYADPPWRFLTYSEKGKGRSAERHYPTMAKEDIQKLPVNRISTKDCVLFLWVTAPCLIEGLELIKAWGFTYKTVAFTWVKQNKRNDKPFMGLGYYTRANAEYCLIATKGKVLERKSRSVSSVVISHIERHSKKPDEVRKRIVELYGNRPRIELFAREYSDGWDCFGNEV
ncbi:MAG: adenine methyltransferase [Clostridia bacterium]|nr:adenine methyltransferase [Clostridia bacterium]